ncbi:hypothetical protein GCM10018952_57020 [Streptosporangium vulgare]
MRSWGVVFSGRGVVLSGRGVAGSRVPISRGEGFPGSRTLARRRASWWVRRPPPMRRRTGACRRGSGGDLGEVVHAEGVDQAGVLGLLRPPEHGEQPDHRRGGDDEQLSSGRAEALVNPLQRPGPADVAEKQLTGVHEDVPRAAEHE